MRLEGLGQLKLSNDFIGNRTRDLPAFSIVLQLTMLPRILRFHAEVYLLCEASRKDHTSCRQPSGYEVLGIFEFLTGI
jgi:hypothetical protein